VSFLQRRLIQYCNIFPGRKSDVLSRERKEELREARDFRRCSGEADAVDSTTKHHPTEEKDVKSRRNKCIVILDDNIAKLIECESEVAKLLHSSSLHCIDNADNEKDEGHEEDSVTTKGIKIMKLVSQIINRRGNVPADPSTGDKNAQVISDQDKKSSCLPSVLVEEKSKNPPDGTAVNSSSRLKSECLDYEDLEKCFSVTSITYHQPYIFNDSENSLFDRRSSMSVRDFYQNKVDCDDGDKDSPKLEILADEHKRVPHTFSSKEKTAHSRAYNDNDNFVRYAGEGDGEEEYYSDEDGKEVPEEELYSDESVEYPPRGYHRFSPTPNSYSRSRASTRTSSSSERKSNRISITLRGNQRKSFHSHCSSYAPSSKKERAVVAAVDVNEEELPNTKGMNTDDVKSVGVTRDPRLQPEIVHNDDDRNNSDEDGNHPHQGFHEKSPSPSRRSWSASSRNTSSSRERESPTSTNTPSSLMQEGLHVYHQESSIHDDNLLSENKQPRKLS
jgi:hypothetical protein